MSFKVYEFDRAIVRRPATSVTKGLRKTDRGDPSYPGVVREHDAYVAALREAGVQVEVLEPLEEYPDSVFVEDPALVFSVGAIALRPGAPSRAGEAYAMIKVLARHFKKVLQLPRGFVDGGDVLRTPEKVMIGLSARTNLEGAEALIECLAELGLSGVIVNTPGKVLHFKSDSSLLDEATVLTTRRLSGSGVFAGFKEILVPAGEDAAANALRVNDRVLAGADFPATIELLSRAGFQVTPVPTSEIRRIDAGLSCMSLRWHQ